MLGKIERPVAEQLVAHSWDVVSRGSLNILRIILYSWVGEGKQEVNGGRDSWLSTQSTELLFQQENDILIQ